MMSKPSVVIAPIDFDAATRAVDKFSADRKIPSMVYPAEEKGRGVVETAPTPSVALATASRRKVIQRIPVEMPDYVFDEIKQRALASRCSARHIILKALRSAGIHIADEDMPEDGRRLR